MAEERSAPSKPPVGLSLHLDLRTGAVCWDAPDPLLSSAGPLPKTVDVAIVGSGIMGAIVAERLSRDGRQVALFDRRAPATGATAGSTALVMWAADTPLSALSRRIGADRAAAAWRSLHRACTDLRRRIEDQQLDCDLLIEPELYLAGDLLAAHELGKEAELRQAAGLPSLELSAADISSRFGIPPRPGLLSTDVYSLDPIALTTELLRKALERGAKLFSPVEIVRVEPATNGALIIAADGAQVRAREVVLATGYEAARPDLPEAFSLGSSYAIATAPRDPASASRQAMIWEASEGYLYTRPTADGRIVLGGLDENFWEPAKRDALLADKRKALEVASEGLLGSKIDAECAWSATFGRSPDGLPAIGRSQRASNIWLAYGFGGNGVTFAALAAELISSGMKGAGTDETSAFDPYRPLPED